MLCMPLGEGRFLTRQASALQPGFLQEADLSAGTLLDKALLVRRVTSRAGEH